MLFPVQPKGHQILKPFAAILMLLAAVGCVPETATGSCGAAGLQSLIGQDKTVLQTMKFGHPVRIVDFGQIITMDFVAERMNIQIDEAGLISRVWCG